MLFLEYLYDSANLGFDAAQREDFEPFRRRLTASFLAAPACDSWQWLWCGIRALAGMSLSGSHETVRSSGKSPQLFAPACHLHESIDYPWFANLRLEGADFNQQLVDWLENHRKVFFIDAHKGVRESCLHGSVSRQPSGKSVDRHGSEGT